MERTILTAALLGLDAFGLGGPAANRLPTILLKDAIVRVRTQA